MVVFWRFLRVVFGRSGVDVWEEMLYLLNGLCFFGGFGVAECFGVAWDGGVFFYFLSN